MANLGHDTPHSTIADMQQRNFVHNDDYPLYYNMDEVEVRLRNWTHVACVHDRCMCCGSLQPHLDSLLISISGVQQARTSGQQQLRAPMAIGVQFRQNGFNIGKPVRGDPQPSRQKAELLAAVEALQVVKMIARPGCLPVDGLRSLGHVVIKTGSRQLVRGISQWVTHWRNNKFRDFGDGCGIRELAPLLIILDNLVKEMNELGVWVQFWRVHPERVQGAERLAYEALTRRDGGKTSAVPRAYAA